MLLSLGVISGRRLRLLAGLGWAFSSLCVAAQNTHDQPLTLSGTGRLVLTFMQFLFQRELYPLSLFFCIGLAGGNRFITRLSAALPLLARLTV